MVNEFRMHLQGSTQYELVDQVIGFVGQDDSGSFGILPGHERIMTVLTYGLARYQHLDDSWTYIALPGGVLYFVDNELYISTPRYTLDNDYQRISKALLEQFLAEEEQLRTIKDRLYHLEQEMFKRLWKMERGAT